MKKLIVIMLGAFILSNTAVAKPDKEKGHKSLPPGLEKKMERGQQLPPGWEKKLEVGKPIEKEVYEQSKVVVPVDDKGLLTIEVGGKLVRLYEATHEVVEILK